MFHLNLVWLLPDLLVLHTNYSQFFPVLYTLSEPFSSQESTLMCLMCRMTVFDNRPFPVTGSRHTVYKRKLFWLHSLYHLYIFLSLKTAKQKAKSRVQPVPLCSGKIIHYIIKLRRLVFVGCTQNKLLLWQNRQWNHIPYSDAKSFRNCFHLSHETGLCDRKSGVPFYKIILERPLAG